MEKTPFVSVMLPVYKGFALYGSIQSILNQTYGDFELIILNDCSPDNVEDTVKMFKDPRIRYYRNSENMGKTNLGGVWNKLLSLSRGVYGVIAGDDDVYDRYFLQEMVDLSRKYHEVELFHSAVNIINRKNEIIGKSVPCPEYEKQGSFIYERRVHRRVQFAPEFFFRIKTLQDFGGFVTFPLAWLSDDASWYLLARNGCVASSKYLVSWRSSGENITSKADCYREKVHAAECYSVWMKHFLSSEQYDSSLPEEACQRLQHSVEIAPLRTFLYISRTSSWGFFIKLLRDREIIQRLHLSCFKLFLDKVTFLLIRKVSNRPKVKKIIEQVFFLYKD